MKKRFLVLMLLLLSLFWVVPAGASPGRTAGSGDATGLIEDETDFLTHPSYLAAGKGVQAYGFYRLTYDKASSRDYKLWAGNGSESITNDFTASGYTWKNQLQAGAAFGLGAGRMAFFLEGTDSRGTFNDGRAPYTGAGGWGNGVNTFEMENKLDDVNLRLLYGMPAGSVNVGAELQVGYVKESQDTKTIEHAGYTDANFPWAAENDPAWNLYPYMIPYDSKYWQAQGKVSVSGKAGGASYAATVRAGLPFASDNHYVYGFDGVQYADVGGKVQGFNAGGEVWLRVPVSANVALPFVVSADYKTIKRDGSGIDWNWGHTSGLVNYDHTTTRGNVKVGGGVDMTPGKGTKVAAGLYYDYICARQDTYNDWATSSWYYNDTHTDTPKYTEHRATVKAMVEKELAPAVVLRGGVNAFYGFVQSNYAYAAYDNAGAYYALNVSTNGSNAGVNASVGASVKLSSVTLEPFVNAGYVNFKTNGDGTFGYLPAQMEFAQTNWLVGGGLSVSH